jgi:hypothetical protein
MSELEDFCDSGTQMKGIELLEAVTRKLVKTQLNCTELQSVN